MEVIENLLQLCADMDDGLGALKYSDDHKAKMTACDEICSPKSTEAGVALHLQPLHCLWGIAAVSCYVEFYYEVNQVQNT